MRLYGTAHRRRDGGTHGGVGWYLCTGAAPAADAPGCVATVRAVQMDNGSHAAVDLDWGGGAAGRGRIDAETAQMLLGALGNSGTQCPACDNIIQKIDGDTTMMCGCEARCVCVGSRPRRVGGWVLDQRRSWMYGSYHGRPCDSAAPPS